jgi:hypothetical protein
VHFLAWNRIRVSMLVIVPLCVIILALFLNPALLLAHSGRNNQLVHAREVETIARATLQKSSRQARIFAASGVYTLRATEIIGTNAHLSLLPNLLHPALTFTASTIYGFSLSHPFDGETVTISSGGVVTTTGTTIKTSILSDIVTGLQSFANKADLLILAAGGTVKTLVMTNVTLTVDQSIALDSIAIPQFQLVVE